MTLRFLLYSLTLAGIFDMDISLCVELQLRRLVIVGVLEETGKSIDWVEKTKYCAFNIHAKRLRAKNDDRSCLRIRLFSLLTAEEHIKAKHIRFCQGVHVLFLIMEA